MLSCFGLGDSERGLGSRLNSSSNAKKAALSAGVNDIVGYASDCSYTLVGQRPSALSSSITSIPMMPSKKENMTTAGVEPAIS